MKYLIVLGLLTLLGCFCNNNDTLPSNISEAKFHAGEKVKVNIYFYSQCSANIISFENWKSIKYGNRYNVNLFCGVDSGGFQEQKFYENDLQKIGEE